MEVFAAGELAGMQGTAEQSMMDTCVIQAWSSTTDDDWGQREETWTDGSATV